jgi:hypothetical protein
MGFDPDSSDLPMLLDASSPSALDLHRIYAAEALGSLGDEGTKVLRIMQEREKHLLVRFYVIRELIDLEDESVEAFLNGPMPPNSSPNRRSLWIYGNFESGELTTEQALKRISKLMQDPKRRHDWLKDHIQQSD